MRLELELKKQAGFSPNERRIANYVLSHKDEVLHMPIKRLASVTYTSPSAVMRLCARLRLSGFKEFKIRLAQELSEVESGAPVNPNYPFQRSDSAGQVASSIGRLSTYAMNDAINTLSVADVRKATDSMRRASRVALFGSGDSFLEAQLFQARMLRTGVSYLIASVAGEQIHLARSLGGNDCALVLSYSGFTPDVVKCARALDRQGVRTIAMTSHPSSPVGRLADVVLRLPSEETKYERVASFYSQVAMGYYLNVLYSYLFVLDYDRRIASNID